MSFFSGVRFVLFCFVLLRFFRLFAFTEAAALRSIVLRPSTCMRDNHACFFFFFPFFLFFFLKMSLFPVFFVPFTVFYFHVEYVVVFPLQDGVFYLETTGWIFDVSLLRDNLINQSISRLLL